NSTRVCVNGTCGFTCNTGFTPCGNSCVNTNTSLEHCGGCNDACTTGILNAMPVCRGGDCDFACTPASGLTKCGNQCVDTNENINHCGECDNPCQAVANGDHTCDESSCKLECDP